MIKRNLTVKQQRFIEAFNGNATEAAIMAGYSKNSAKEIGYENLTKHVTAGRVSPSVPPAVIFAFV